METITLFLANVGLPYLVMSLVCLIVHEIIALFLGLRGGLLHASIVNMLGREMASRFFAHPIVRSLAPEKRAHAYVTTRMFTIVVMDLIVGAPDVSHRSSHESPLSAVLRTAPFGKASEAVMDWFQEVMDRASGTYRADTLKRLALIATLMVASFNLDAISMTRFSLNRPTMEDTRKEMIKAVLEKYSKGPDAATTAAAATTGGVAESSVAASGRISDVMSVTSEPLPIGWAKFYDRDLTPSALVLKIVGLLLSIVAIVVGAPFLFDVLNRVMVIRSTMKPHERGWSGGEVAVAPFDDGDAVVEGLSPLARPREDDDADYEVGIAVRTAP